MVVVWRAKICGSRARIGKRLMFHCIHSFQMSILCIIMHYLFQKLTNTSLKNIKSVIVINVGIEKMLVRDV